jgi:hypothetical protein
MAVNTTTKGSDTPEQELAGDARETMADVRTAVADVREKAASVAARAPEMAETTRGVVQDAVREMESGSDEALAIGASFALGASVGLLVGGAPRLLIAATLIPVAAAGMILLDRAASPTRGTQRRGA